MATTSPDNLRTPNPGDSYNLVPDLATLANDVQAALLTRSARFGTAAQRAAFLSTAPAGFLWQDTDGIGMIWKKAGAVWVPAVWRWAGTTAQMNAFTQAPNGFEWFNTTDNSDYVRLSGSWSNVHPTVSYSLVSGALASASWTVLSSSASWSASGSTFTWTNGAVIPRTGLYEISLGGRIGAAISVFLGLKVNNTAASNAGVVAMNASTGFAGETGASVSRSLQLNAGDVVTPAIYTSGAAGPYGLTPSGTFFSVTHLR